MGGFPIFVTEQRKKRRKRRSSAVDRKWWPFLQCFFLLCAVSSLFGLRVALGETTARDGTRRNNTKIPPLYCMGKVQQRWNAMKPGACLPAISHRTNICWHTEQLTIMRRCLRVSVFPFPTFLPKTAFRYDAAAPLGQGRTENPWCGFVVSFLFCILRLFYFRKGSGSRHHVRNRIPRWNV